ncbi:hypothetical protein FBU30_001603 [Linnemannia zychae]|nr:hypothetical protein FBU30_001603 [Linnemannia zychae]
MIEEQFQALRPVNKNCSLSSISSAKNSDIIYLEYHLDYRTNKPILIWGDILRVFPTAVQVRDNAKVYSFLRNPQFKILESLRITANPDVVLDVLVENSLDLGLQEQDNNSLTTNTNPVTNTFSDDSKHLQSPDPQNINSVNRAMSKEAELAQIILKADQGDREAQVTLGDKFKEGQGIVRQNYQSALIWYLKAAEKGYAYAQYKIGYMYKDGFEDRTDNLTAMVWFLKAADRGYAEAQCELGCIYHDGHVTQ